MEQNQEVKRSVWIDLAKILAIFAVMLDHTNGILYRDVSVAISSSFSVGLFIIVMGVNSSWSLLRRKTWNLGNKCWRIGGPYLMATFVFCLLTGGWAFDLEFYLSRVVRFNAAGPFYYVLMYLQFLFAVPILALFTRWSGWRGIGLEIVGFMVCLVIGWFTTNHSNVLHVYGGGGNLLGGTFLILLYMGIWFGKYCRDIRLGKLLSFVEFLVFCVATVAWWGFMVEDRLRMDVLFPFVKSLKFRGNPPGICVASYSCLMAGTVFFLGTLLDYCATNRVRRIMGGVTWLGRHTLYIFLYHNFWRDVLKRIPCISGMGFTWLKWVIYFSVMILGSLLFEVVFKWLYHVVVMAYRPRQPSVEERN